ncbi:MAG TPA: N-acetylmuramoyl-L-alanine amidase [Verrucomicrobiae bacterium]|nr:N-acetylmuramoyl-L-alanine amidase [Verrucomicrobiae bacterium]
MKFFRVLLLWLAIFASPARAAFINGQNYVALSGWAHANGFHFSFANRNDVILSNGNARLVFDVDSAEAQINGVNIRLSFPVAKGALISQFDLDKTIRPLLSPGRYLPPKKITTICLDPGHGGKDTGNRVGNFFYAHNEKTYTLALALELREQLRRAGFNVILTRSKDVYVDLPARPAIANRAGADLFISLHFNATPTSKNEVQGTEVYCITPVGASSSNSQGEGADHGATAANRVEQKSLLLAYQMQKSLVQNLRVNDRDVRRARFAVLRDAQMPAILIEGGYMTHPVESKKIYDATYRQQMAAAIVKGILAYQKLSVPMVIQPAIKSTPKKKSP